MKVSKICAIGLIAVVSVGCSSEVPEVKSPTNELTVQEKGTMPTPGESNGAEDAKRIRCASYVYETNDLPLMIQAYNTSNEEKYTVKYEEPKGFGLRTTQELQVISTELLTGTAPEIICLEGLPYKTYLEKGVLKELSISEEVKATIHPRLRELCEQDGELKMLPINMLLSELFVNESILQELGIAYDFTHYTIEDFIKVGEELEKVKSEEIYFLSKYSTICLIQDMVQILYYDTIQSGKKLKEEDLRILIKQLKQLQSWEHPTYTYSDIIKNDKDQKSQVVCIPAITSTIESTVPGYTFYLGIESKEGYSFIRTNGLYGVTTNEKEEITKGFFEYMLAYGIQATWTQIPVTIEVMESWSKKAELTKDADKQRKIEKTLEGINEAQGFFIENVTVQCLQDQIWMVLSGEQEEDAAVKNVMNYLMLNQIQ
ncbi:MAG: hypothetical protein ACRDDX_14050 [Cellulosilyticaceae bacterium]